MRVVVLAAALGLLAGPGCNVTRTAFEAPKAVVPEFDTAPNYQVKRGVEQAEYKFDSVAVLPFGRPGTMDLDETVKTQINRLDDLFAQRLSEYGHYKVASPSDVALAMDRHALRHIKRKDFEQATIIGRELGVDTVLVGEVTRWKEREGGALGAKEPASVAFQAFLLRADNGAMVWSTNFSKTQQPLSENVLEVENFLKGGATWQTSDTLARLGVEEVMRTFPGHEGVDPRNLKF